jgi:ribonuclease HI
MSLLEIYTDGSYKNGWGSWAFIFVQNQKIVFEKSSRVKKTDSLRMEYQAAIESLKSLPQGSRAHLYSDCRILIENLKKLNSWAENSWLNRNGFPIPNSDLLMQLQSLIGEKSVTWKWVKAHAGLVFNERCDQLCIQARENNE